MRLHHDKHHQAYIDKANAALDGTDLDGRPVEDALQLLASLPSGKQTAFRNNGGGHANHSLFWDSMSPAGGGEPDGELASRSRPRLARLTPSRSASRPAASPNSAPGGHGWSTMVTLSS